MRSVFDAATDDLYPTDYKEAHGDRAISTPILEAAILALGGLALGAVLFAGSAYGAVVALNKSLPRTPSLLDPPGRP